MAEILRCGKCGAAIARIALPENLAAMLPPMYRPMLAVVKVGDVSRVLVGALISECVKCNPISKD